MEKLSDRSLIQRFIDNDPVGTLAFRHKLKCNPEEELFCDNADDPHYIFAAFEWTGFFHAIDKEAVEAFIPHIPKKHMMFAGVRHEWARMICEAYEPVWSSHCHLIWWPHREIDIEIEHEVRPLTLDDADLVNKHWDIGKGDSLDYVQFRIKEGIHVGSDDEEGLVSWALTHDDGSMGFLYTMQRGRRKGYAHSVGAAHIRKILEAGETPFAFVVVGNEASMNFSKVIGLIEDGQADYFGLNLEESERTP
jgi:hypothetical protein